MCVCWWCYVVVILKFLVGGCVGVVCDWLMGLVVVCVCKFFGRRGEVGFLGLGGV